MSDAETKTSTNTTDSMPTETDPNTQDRVRSMPCSVNGWAAVKYEKLHDLDESLRYRCRLVCADCGGQLNVTSELSKQELREAWTHLCFSSGLVAGKCPKGCRSTFSDCNINTRLVVEGRSQIVPALRPPKEDVR